MDEAERLAHADTLIRTAQSFVPIAMDDLTWAENASLRDRKRAVEMCAARLRSAVDMLELALRA